MFLLVLSAFFSISETSLMAVNRYRMRHLAENGNRGAKQVLALLKQTDKLLGTILLGNNVVNAALTALVTALAIKAFGNNDQVLAMATTTAALLLIVFAELIPKVTGANKPDGIAMLASYILMIFVWLLRPFVFAINQIVSYIYTIDLDLLYLVEHLDIPNHTHLPFRDSLLLFVLLHLMLVEMCRR